MTPSNRQTGETTLNLRAIGTEIATPLDTLPPKSVEPALGVYRCSVLIVDDEPAILGLLRELLATDFEVLTAGSAEEAKELFAKRSVDILLTDQQLPGQAGVQLLEHVCLHSPQTIRILMTGMGRLEDAVDAINCGRVHRYLFKPWKSEQLLHTLHQAARNFLLERSHGQLVEELRRLNLGLEQRVQQRTLELEQANRQLQQRNTMLTRMALTDALTGLPNRRAMDRLARNEMFRRARYPTPMALAIFDVDHFKEVNSRFLLSGGDHALTWLGQTLAQAVRTVDTIGRVGGEEFLLIAPETEADGAWTLAERIRISVEQGRTMYAGADIQLTMSCGVIVVPKEVPAGFEQLRHSAAAALGEAKSAGRNRTVMRVLSPPGERVAAVTVKRDESLAR